VVARFGIFSNPGFARALRHARGLDAAVDFDKKKFQVRGDSGFIVRKRKSAVYEALRWPVCVSVPQLGEKWSIGSIWRPKCGRDRPTNGDRTFWVSTFW